MTLVEAEYVKVPIFCDNTSAIAISNNLVLYSRTKHIDIRYHLIRDHILKGEIELHFILTQYQLADIFTKPLNEPTFKRLIVELDSTKVWFSTPTKDIKGDVGVTSFKNAIGENYLPYSKDYAAPPSIETVKEWFPIIRGKIRGFDQISNKDAIILFCLANGVNIDFSKLIWDDIISKLKKKNKEKVIPYLRFLSLLLEYKMEGYGTDELNLWHLKLLKPPLNLRRRFPTAHNLELKLDEGGNQPLLQQSIILSAEIDPGKSASNDSVSQQQDKTQSAGDGLEIFQTKAGTEKEANNVEKEVSFDKYEFNTSPGLSSSDDTTKEIKLDSPEDDEPIIVQDEEEEEVHAKVHTETEDTSVLKTPSSPRAQPSYPNVEQLTELLVAELNKLKLEVPAGLLALPGLLNKVTKSLDKFSQAIESASQTTGDKSVPSAGQAGINPVEREKNTKQATINQLFQQRTTKDAAKANLNKEPIPTTTSEIQLSFYQSLQLQQHNSNLLSSSEDAEEKESESDSDAEIKLTSSMVESSQNKRIKKFAYSTKGGETVFITEEHINEKKKIEQSVKDDMAKKEVELGKEELVGIDVVKNVHKEKDLIIKLNDLAKKKRKHADEIHEYFRSTKKYKSSDEYEDHPAGTVLNERSWEEIVGSVPELFSLSVDLNIKSSKCNLAEDKFSFS
ncbi:hypothetical protein Tco_1225019 [Tanacetum coccineum]